MRRCASSCAKLPYELRAVAAAECGLALAQSRQLPYTRAAGVFIGTDIRIDEGGTSRINGGTQRICKIAGTLPVWQDMPITWLAIAGLACTITGFIVMFFTQNQGYGGLFVP